MASTSPPKRARESQKFNCFYIKYFSYLSTIIKFHFSQTLLFSTASYHGNKKYILFV